MYIHEIIIDGFKSYAKRTVISGFDPQFNAITGLNGTGKSNILDAICFVLGITKLAEVIFHSSKYFDSDKQYCTEAHQ
jgi:structural maintenance of chromosome 2